MSERREPAPELAADADWDAGDMGCGELLIELRARFGELSPRSLFHLVARDPGAIEDMPSWCRLTGHELVRARHPEYWIRTREKPRS